MGGPAREREVAAAAEVPEVWALRQTGAPDLDNQTIRVRLRLQLRHRRVMKITVRQNIWGNWRGYAGRRRVKFFGLDWMAAEIWQAWAQAKVNQRRKR